jgi:hypothetical protein
MTATKWNTYAVRGYTFQAGTDPRATGGVHLHQVRKGKSGWMTRVVDSNGPYQSAGKATPVSAADGEAMYQTFKSR